VICELAVPTARDHRYPMPAHARELEGAELAAWLGRQRLDVACFALDGEWMEWGADEDPALPAERLAEIARQDPGMLGAAALEVLSDLARWSAQLREDVIGSQPRSRRMEAFVDRVADIALGDPRLVRCGSRFVFDVSPALAARVEEEATRCSGEVAPGDDWISEVPRRVLERLAADRALAAEPLEALGWALRGGGLGSASRLVSSAMSLAASDARERRGDLASRSRARELRAVIASATRAAHARGALPTWSRVWCTQHLAHADPALLAELEACEPQPWLAARMRAERSRAAG
jgi:hypothetical protein